MDNKNYKYNKNHNIASALLMIIASIGGVLYGYDIGIINGVLLFIKHDIPMTDIQLGLIVGAVILPSAIAIIIAGKLADWLGRRSMIRIASLIFMVSVICVVLSNSYEMVLYSRWLQGLAVGILTIVVPLYLAESVPSHLRGRGVGMFQLFLTGGILLGAIVNYFLVPTHNWRLMFGTALVPAIILFIGCFFIPKSPRWLLMKGYKDKAIGVLSLLNPTGVAKSECENIVSAIKRDTEEVGAGFFAFISAMRIKHFLLPFLISIVISILTQATGINSILQYSAVILSKAGLSTDSAALLGTNFIVGINFIVTIVSLVLVDKLGRKFILGLGTAVICLALCYCGFIFYFYPYGDTKAILLMIGLVFYVIGFSIGPGVCVFIVLSELMPSHIRSLGLGMALCLNSLIGGLLSSYFLFFARNIGYSTIFWICSGFALIYFLIAIFIIPETKNQSLEEIENNFINN